MSNHKEIKYKVSLNEAKEILFKSAHPVEKKEIIDVSLSLYRVIAEDVISDIDVPPFDISSKDGYAVNINGGSLGLSIPFKEIAEKEDEIKPRECIWVETGRRITQGANGVVPAEMVKKVNNNVFFTRHIQLGKNIFKKAVFLKRGEIILRKGTLIDERKIGLFPFLGEKEIEVYKKVKIGIISIGKNITKRNDINWVILKSLIENNGGRVIWVKRVKSCDEFISIFRDEKNLDFIVSSGGVSKGREDFVFAAISKIGTPIFHGVRIKPGKPLCFGKINETPILSLSGNPTPCLITAYIFLVPLLRKMAHLPFKTEAEQLKVGASLNIKKIGKEGVKILPIKIENGLVLFSNIPFCFNSIMGLKDTMGLAIIDEGVEEIRKGSNVKVFKFNKY